MAVRSLNPKEQKVMETFKTVKMEPVETTHVTFTARETVFTVKEPAVYRIPGSNVTVIFGELTESMSMRRMAELLRERMADQAKESEEGREDEKQEEKEIDGEAEMNSFVEKTKENDEKVNEDDLALLQEHTGMSREDAYKVLKEANFDVIAALVEINKKKE